MTKYSVLFLLPGVGIAMLTLRSARIAWRDVVIAAIVGAIVVAPNLWWNLTHGAATVKHTESIAQWSSGGGGTSLLKHVLNGLKFRWRAVRRGRTDRVLRSAVGDLAPDPGRSDDREKLLFWLSVPVVALISLQALFAKAQANWAVCAYSAGTILAVWLLYRLTNKGLGTSLIIGAVVAFVIPVLTVFALDIKLPNGDLVMKRYVGRSIISQEIADIATTAKTTDIVSPDRDIIADLFYTLKGKPFRIYARNSVAFPRAITSRISLCRPM